MKRRDIELLLREKLQDLRGELAEERRQSRPDAVLIADMRAEIAETRKSLARIATPKRARKMQGKVAS